MRLDPSPELIDRLYGAAWAMCGSAHDAEDLVQETFARVLARPRPFRRADPGPYLLRTLRNTHLTSIRTASRRPRTTALPSDESAAMRSTLPGPEVALEQQEALEAIAALPTDFREALIAVDVIGLSHREAARALATREPTISTRLFRARQRLVRAAGDRRDARTRAGSLVV
jgi:RNA polymerase sigma-70 factor (ECF subfamily)